MNTKLKGTCTPNSPNSVCSSLFPDRRPTPCLSVKQVFVEQGISKLIHHRHSEQYSRITRPLAYSSKKKVSYHFSAYKPPIAPSGLQEKLYVPYPGYQVSVLQDEEVPAKRWDPTLTLRQALGKLSIDKEGQRERKWGLGDGNMSPELNRESALQRASVWGHRPGKSYPNPLGSKNIALQYFFKSLQHRDCVDKGKVTRLWKTKDSDGQATSRERLGGLKNLKLNATSLDFWYFPVVLLGRIRQLPLFSLRLTYMERFPALEGKGTVIPQVFTRAPRPSGELRYNVSYPRGVHSWGAQPESPGNSFPREIRQQCS